MKKTLPLLSLLTLATTALATIPNDFVGDYELLEGNELCEQSLTIIQSNDNTCLRLASKNPEMNWARTEKICNINEAPSLTTEDIPAPVFLGTITHSDYAIMKDTMITSADTLIHSYLQTTQYTTGATHRLGGETYMRLNDENNLQYSSRLHTVVNDEVEKAELRDCVYQRI